MKDKIPFLEIVRRVVLIITTSFVFEAPGLKTLRNILLRPFFKFGPNTRFKMGAKLIIIHPNSRIKQTITIGDYCEIGVESMLDYSGGIEIGDDVWISQNVKVFTHIHPINGEQLKRTQKITFHRLIIGDDAWLGAGCIILPSVNIIGKGAVIGAGSVVTRDVDDYVIVAGNPAKRIGSRLNNKDRDSAGIAVG